MALRQGRQDPGPAREDHRQPGRLSLDVRAGGADVPVRHAAQRRVRDGRPSTCEVTGVFTNTTPVDAYRGAGRPGGLLPARADGGRRRRPRSRWTRSSCGGRTSSRSSPTATRPRSRCRYDSGNYGAALDKLLGMLDYKKFRAEQAAAREQGRLMGIGFSTYIEACSIAPSKVVGSLGAQAGLWESGKVRVHPTGRVTRVHRLALARAGARDDVRPDRGRRASASRWTTSRSSTATPAACRSAWAPTAAARPRSGGTAILMSLDKIKEKGKKIAAHLLEASPEGHGVRRRPVPGEGLARRRRSRSARSRSPPTCRTTIRRASSRGSRRRASTTRRTSASRSAPTPAWSRSIRDTGHVKILRYVAVDDVGNVINPMIVDGMVHGGIAQGVGAGALGGRGLRQGLRPARHGQHDGLRAAEGGHAADVRDRPHRDADARSTRSASRARARRARSPRPRRSSTRWWTPCRGLGVDHIEAMPLTPSASGRSLRPPNPGSKGRRRHVPSPVRVPHARHRQGGAGPARAPQGRRQAPGGRPQPAPDDEAAPGPAQAPDRPPQGVRASPASRKTAARSSSAR